MKKNNNKKNSDTWLIDCFLPLQEGQDFFFLHVSDLSSPQGYNCFII